MRLIDKYGRPLTHMRISVTLKCNHNCIFCHHEGIPGISGEELSASEWVFVAEAAVELGIKYYKITGGEPLVRSDIPDIVAGITGVGGEVSLVTNGSLLSQYAVKLAEAGLARINISLHSLNPSVFKNITRGDLNRVLEGIKSAVDAGIPVKIDYLVLSLNEDEYKEIISYAERIGADLNIIELIPLGMSLGDYNKLHRKLDKIQEYLEQISTRKYVKEFQSRPTYVLPTGIQVTLVKGYDNPELCMRCTRIRATPDGKLKTCIYRNDILIDMKPAIKERDKEALKKLIEKANSLREPFFKSLKKNTAK
ncbi:GTP 3',8-cyclase MoaA [Desulfurococcaceae archaeon MEX13E-LK6-19]|nr:GTP 3',8-cyclase MoaA [Desulfurococcaceae archaeon MEX13E-LK6-19]